MNDGASLGVTADRALKTILGGRPSPSEDEVQNRDEVLARIAAVSDPLDGLPLWEREGDAYGLGADVIAKAFLIVTRDDPRMLREYTLDTLWNLVCDRWKGFDEWIGVASGFQVAFAVNTARYVTGQPTGDNPAIVALGSSS